VAVRPQVMSLLLTIYMFGKAKESGCDDDQARVVGRVPKTQVSTAGAAVPMRCHRLLIKVGGTFRSMPGCHSDLCQWDTG
jgi:hypothetical protein